MAEPVSVAEVWLWDRFVGAVAELDDGQVLFEFDSGFLSGKLGISPLHLPVREGVFSFPELARKTGFNGLPGVLADALPDSFGKAVIRSYFTARGEVEKALSPVQHLLYVGNRAIGALEFRPAADLETRPQDHEALEIAALVQDARAIVDGGADVAVPEIYRIGGSAGGMRPKAIVLHNKGEIRSAFAPRQPGDTPALLKFDGVDPEAPPGMMGKPQPYNRVEAAYSDLASQAGLDAVDVSILESGDGHAHLIIPRFDLDSEGRPIHQHTLGGLLHVDYNEPAASGYEEYLRASLALGMSGGALQEAYRRMVFNVLAINQDDHVKNLSFHMLPDGTWRLAPAYDLTFAQGAGWTRHHQMRVNGKVAGITRDDLTQVAETFAIKGAHAIIQSVEEALSRWAEAARLRGVPADVVATIRKALSDRRAEVMT